MNNENLIITEYPEFTNLDTNQREELRDIFKGLKDGISEFTFDCLLVHDKKFNFQVSKIKNTETIIITGKEKNQSLNTDVFFSILGDIPESSQNDEKSQEFEKILVECFDKFGYWKLMGESQYNQLKDRLENLGYTLEFDRDNADYVYSKKDLADLPGKALHKKKNLVNTFIKNYDFSVKQLDKTTVEDARSVLEIWKENRDLFETDYYQCIDALDDIKKTDSNFSGIITYVDKQPVAWTLGEILPDNKTFATHFEKGDSEFKGVYQFINKAMAEALPENIEYINREQDLGDEGMRQAKMTYRPCCFVNKYIAYKNKA